MSKKNERLHRGLWEQISRPHANVVVPLTDISISSQYKRVAVIGLKDREYVVEVRNIVARCRDGKDVTTSAAVIGRWAVHPPIKGGAGMSVTHACSGIGIVSCAAELEMADAFEIAMRLNVVPEKMLSVARGRFLDGWDHVALAIIGEVLGG